MEDLGRRIAEERIRHGNTLFGHVRQTRLDARVHAFAAWRQWVFGVLNELDESDALSSLATLLVALARQEVMKWSQEQLDAIAEVLAAWQASPRPLRGRYEEWDDRLVAAGIHVPTLVIMQEPRRR